MNARTNARGLRHGRGGWTMADVVVTVVVVGVVLLLVIGLGLPSIGGTHCGGRDIKDGTQVRGIHQGLVLFAQGNRDQYPVPSQYDKDNTTLDLGSTAPEGKDTTANVVSALIYSGFFSTELCVSPAEQNGSIVQDTDYAMSLPPTAAKPEQALWDPAFSADFTGGRQSNFSYATAHFMGARRALWANTFQSREAAIGNRGPRVTGLTEKGGPVLENPTSTTLLIHGGRSTWEGNIAYNDNHVNFETSMTPESAPYVFNGVSRSDCLFYDEPEDGSQLNNLLTIITQNGAGASDTKTIWD